jgi:hypothetical protein
MKETPKTTPTSNEGPKLVGIAASISTPKAMAAAERKARRRRRLASL